MVVHSDVWKADMVAVSQILSARAPRQQPGMYEAVRPPTPLLTLRMQVAHFQ